MWIPIFGWCMWKGGMIPVDRGAGSQALIDMTARAREEIRSGRQLIIFPEGTRRSPGAEPRYKFGVAHLYAEVGVPCVPVALNSGLFWPRRAFLRFPARSSSNSFRRFRRASTRTCFFNGCRATSRRRPRGWSRRAALNSKALALTLASVRPALANSG